MSLDFHPLLRLHSRWQGGSQGVPCNEGHRQLLGHWRALGPCRGCLPQMFRWGEGIISTAYSRIPWTSLRYSPEHWASFQMLRLQTIFDYCLIEGSPISFLCLAHLLVHMHDAMVFYAFFVYLDCLTWCLYWSNWRCIACFYIVEFAIWIKSYILNTVLHSQVHSSPCSVH